jgi:high-affinity K+ transport system ATPase subunit B
VNLDPFPAGPTVAGQDRHHHLGEPDGRPILPIVGVDKHGRAEAVHLASLADEIPEGRSMVEFVESRYDLHQRQR